MSWMVKNRLQQYVFGYLIKTSAKFTVFYIYIDKQN